MDRARPGHRRYAGELPPQGLAIQPPDAFAALAVDVVRTGWVLVTRRITLLAIDFPPQGGGISRYLHDIARHTRPAQLTVIAPPAPVSAAVDGTDAFRVCRLEVAMWRRWPKQALKLLAPKYLAALWRERPDVVLCGQAHYSVLIPAFIVALLRGVPYVVMIYGLDVLGSRRKIYGPVANWLLRSSSGVVACSKMAASLAVGIGVPAERVHVAYPEVSGARLQHTASVDVRAQHGLQRDTRILLSVGRLIPRKGFDTVIRALPYIRRSIPNVQYVLVGTGPDESRLRSLAKETGTEACVRFVGYVDDEDLSAYYQACDLFVMPSREIPDRGDIEGFGIVYLEAALFGKPSIAGASGGAGEAVLDGATGLLVNPSDPRSVADAAIRLLRDRSLADQLGVAARARALAEFAEGSSARAVMTALDAVVPR